ncbi:MAG: insulinase family protein [Candidatus Chisholmbacteria bacterium]|nr:insulinase family protein [Candidatus Chisholmbacteria bacterium]
MKFEYSLDTLPNGLRVVLVPMTTPAVTALAQVGVGSRFESPKISGLSHFVEHMVFKGTGKYPTAMAVASAVDAVGAEYNAFTSKEYTGFYVKAASQHLKLALDILGEFLFKPRLNQADIERERGVIIEEINMYEDTPMRRVGDLFDQLLYKGHSLAQDVIGTKESVGGVQRADFVGHMRRWYQPNRMVLAIAGDKERLARKNRVLSLVEKLFDGKGEVLRLPGGSRTARSAQPLDSARDRRDDDADLTSVSASSSEEHDGGGDFKLTSPERLFLKEKKTEQAHFSLGVLGLHRGNTRRYVQAILATILGGNMSSRLFSEIREKRGLAYYVRTGVDVFRETGNVCTQAGVKLDKLEEAVAAVSKAYSNISKDKKVDQKELTRAKEYLKGSLMLEFDDSQEVASHVGSSLLLEGRVRTPLEILKGIEAVTVDEVTTLASEILRPNEFRLAVIGPGLKRGRLEKAMEG